MVKALIIRNLFYGYSIIMPMPDQDEESRNEKHYVMDLAVMKTDYNSKNPKHFLLLTSC